MMLNWAAGVLTGTMFVAFGCIIANALGYQLAGAIIIVIALAAALLLGVMLDSGSDR
jgi:hypothetical protein